MDFNQLFKSDILQTIFYGNTIQDYLVWILIVTVGFLFKKKFSQYITKIVFSIIRKSTNINVNEFYTIVKKPIDYIILLIFLYFGSRHITFSELGEYWENLINKLYVFTLMMCFIWFFLKITDYFKFVLMKKAEKTSSKLDDQFVPFFSSLVKVLIIVLGVFTVLATVFDVDITALAAGLGVGGIAVAMASKESLENLFGSFIIFLDKPFTVGDIVTIGTISGTIENVGFRSTRIRTFDKSLVTVPNKKMVDAELDNLGMRDSRRIKFNVGLTYDTNKTQIQKIVKDIKKYLDTHKRTVKNFSRVKFSEFDSSSLNIMIIYYIPGTKWDDYLDIKEEINFKIMDIVKKYKSDFAFPSTTVYLKK
jgi:MscS family membrane protein